MKQKENISKVGSFPISRLDMEIQLAEGRETVKYMISMTVPKLRNGILSLFQNIISVLTLKSQFETISISN